MTNTDSYIMKVIKLKEIVKLMKGVATGAVHERTLSFFDKLTCLGIQENQLKFAVQKGPYTIVFIQLTSK